MSSEALERLRQNAREAVTRGWSVTAPSPEAVLELLAEVARLEQERDEARENNAWAGDVIKSADEARIVAEADLAAARAREQRLTRAAEEAAFLLEHIATDDVAARSRQSVLMAIDALFAALAYQPAAATLAEPDAGEGTHRSTVPDSLRTPGSASAAADEPGEQA